MRILLALLAVLGLVACGGDDDDKITEADGSITVFAASSLTDAFEEIGEAFEAAHDGVSVAFNFAGSSALREQILAGAPADVFASANESNMTAIADADGVEGEPATFVTNKLEIAVPADNPGEVTGLADFVKPDLLIGLCAEEVPCGQFGRTALTNAGVTPSIDTDEPDVRSLLTKIEAGELDAGIVYRTDVLAAGDTVQGIEIPAGQNVVAAYPIAALSASSNAELAAAFVAFVLSDEGQQILQSHGFEAA